jgi:hypothetical protein
MMRPLSVLTLVLAAASVATAEAPGLRRSQDAGLRYGVPQSWERVPAPSDMRAAQYRIPGPTPDAADDAEVVLFFFGAGKGGTAEANLERWYAQFTQPDGKPSRDAAVTTVRTVNGLKVTSVDLQGTYTPAQMGTEAKGPRPGTRMLAAVIEGPGGPWFLRVIGPATTLDGVSGEFNQVLRSVEAHQ